MITSTANLSPSSKSRATASDLRESVQGAWEHGSRDPETGLLDRRALGEAIGADWARIGVVVVRIADAASSSEPALHAAVSTLVEVLECTRRARDRCFRLAADRFAVVMPETSEEGVAALAKRLSSLLHHVGVPGRRAHTAVNWVVSGSSRSALQDFLTTSPSGETASTD